MIGYKKELHSSSIGNNLNLNIKVNNLGINYNINNLEGFLSLNKLNRDPASNQLINEPHSIIGVGFRYDNTPFVFDFFKHSYITKTTSGHVLVSSLGIKQGFYLARPWQDTPLIEWKLFAAAKLIVINDVIQENYISTINGNGLHDVLKWLPSIKLTKDNKDNIYVQLLNSDGSEAHKENIEIYLETTTGILEQTRIVTDSLGKAKTKLLFSTKGKVKAGFKFYSGKTEIEID